MAVYVAAHKAFNTLLPDNYIPLFVGAQNKKPIFAAADDSGDNISFKNSSFCELTGLYWVWKNTDDEYKGLVHYRRYFSANGKILLQGQIKKILSSYDVIAAKTEYLRESAYEEFVLHSGKEKDLELLRNVLQKLYPAYIPAFETVMSGNRLHLYNMMIAKKTVFNAYCEWLFDILFELEPLVDMTGYSDYEKRIFGFLAERLLNVWLLHNDLSVCSCAVKNTEQDFKQSARLFLRRIKNRVLFALTSGKSSGGK